MQDKNILDELKEVQQGLNDVAEAAQEAALEIENEGVLDTEDPRVARVMECVRKINLMNAIAGNNSVLEYHPDEALKVLTVQEKVFMEERNETLEAIRHKCYIEILDGLADMFVVQQGIERAVGQVSVEDIQAGKASEDIAGYVGAAIHSDSAGAFSNLLREYAMQSFNIARIGAEKVFLGELGIDPEVYLSVVLEVQEAVCDNNLSKFTKDRQVAEGWAFNFTKTQLKQGYHIREAVIDGESWYSIVDGNGKFRKYKGFKGVDLQPLVDKLLAGVPEDKLVDQEEAYKAFLKATKGV